MALLYLPLYFWKQLEYYVQNVLLYAETSILKNKNINAKMDHMATGSVNTDLKVKAWSIWG